MSGGSAIGVGVIGLGFMGRTHARAYHAARAAGYDCRLAAVCDSDAGRRAGIDEASGEWQRLSSPPPSDSCGASDRGAVSTYCAADDLLADDAVDLVSICTNTESHVDLALQAIAAGKHVLVEKPVALRSSDVRRLAEAVANTTNTLCTPAMCMRFWPGWSWLKEHIDRRTYGAVRSATFQRLSPPPDWSPGFYRDPQRTGGALFDLHIHDADFIRWCFGSPDAIVSTGSIDHLTTLYHYRTGPTHVVAEGGWDLAPGYPFNMCFVVAFDQGTAEFDSRRDDPLTVAREGLVETIELKPLTGYDIQIRHLLHAIADKRRHLTANMEEAVEVARLLEAEQRSLETGEPISLSPWTPARNMSLWPLPETPSEPKTL